MKNFYYIFIAFIVLIPSFVFAQNIKTEDVFKARVSEIIDLRTETRDDGQVLIQQNLLLTGLEGERKGVDYNYFGINEFELLRNKVYKEGESVLVLESFDASNKAQYYVLDHIRTKLIYFVFIAFVLVLFLVGRAKGLRSLLSLFFTFLIIIKFIIPKIISGGNPLFITIVGSFLILFVIIYLTEGFNKSSHIAFISINISLIFSALLSWFVVCVGNLSGIFNEEIGALSMIDGVVINFQGLLLAGIIIGLLGVLDDVVISQVGTVEQIYLADKTQSKKEISKKAMKVGVSHISSMTNTLFLAYAGASLPLLVLVISGGSAFSNMFDIINNEQIATEVIRTLTGSIGLVLSIPLSTFLAVNWISDYNK